MEVQNYIKNVSTLSYDAGKCIGCRLCVEVCPHNVFSMHNKKAVLVNKDKCMECGACALNCEPRAIAVKQGVGCASAVIWGFLRGTEPTCDCNSEKTTSCC